MVSEVTMFYASFLIMLLLPRWDLPQIPNAQGLRTKLQIRVDNYSLSAPTLIQALTKVASQFEIPMGIEWVKEPSTMRTVSFSKKHATVYQIIESLVKSQRGYGFAIGEDIVHVFPRGSLKNTRSFLDLRINRFDVQDEFVAVASYRLRRLVNVPVVSRTATLRRGTSPGLPSPGSGTAGSIAAGSGDRRVSLKVRNATVRNILDRLCLAADLRIWVVSYPPRFTITKGGFRRTVALHTDVSVPDEEQPQWVFLPWGVEPTPR